MYHKPWKKLYLSPGDTAKILGVTPATLRGWTSRGMLRAETTEGGHRRYPVNDVIRVAQQKGKRLELPDDLSLRVLVVDDDEQFSLFLQEVLEAMPEISEVARANSGYAAGNLVPRFKPDVVLLDLKMPGVDGFEVCRAIKGDPDTRFTRVIAMSGYCTKENRQEILRAGAEECLAKPFQIDQLEQVLGLSSRVLGERMIADRASP